MTVEQEIEGIIAKEIKSELENAGIDSIAVNGMLGTTVGLKGEEDASKSGFIFVKASPRQYTTPTIPECQINVKVVMTIDASKDWNGKTYMDVFELLMGKFERWQKCMDDVHQLFTFNNFNISGYQLGAGDTSLDQQKKVWQYVHEMTIYGCIQTNEWFGEGE